MKVPLSWLKEFVDIDLPLLELAKTITMLGLEVEDIRLVGLPNPYEQPGAPALRSVAIHGLSWDAEKFVVAQINEVLPHPNADKLVLCKLEDGSGEKIVLTGAPNLYPFKGMGPLPQPIKVAYAKEGARLYDGHADGLVLTTLKRSVIRGVESTSMVCSEKELGISEEHEGVIFLDADAPTGTPLVDYLGDAVLEVSILPNMARNASIFGVARELAAALGNPLKRPAISLSADGPSIQGKVSIEIRDPDLNPRFLVGMITGAEQVQSPYKVQHRLRLAGMRPINAVVDATNYVMLELGEPLHAFDYDTLVQRANGAAPAIITRTAEPGETLVTLDKTERRLEPYTILVTDTAGPLSLAGVMGGLESEILPDTKNILLEGASWSLINTRRTMTGQKLSSEAGYRFSRGVHPDLADDAVIRCLDLMQQWAGGTVSRDLVDNYPRPVPQVTAQISPADVKRLLGLDLSAPQIADLLSRLDFTCTIDGDTVSAVVPPIRTDISEGVVGTADLTEEVARLYGYDKIPASYLATDLPAAYRPKIRIVESRVREALTRLGLQETASYRLTSCDADGRIDTHAGADSYIELKNPLTPERNVMRRSLLNSVLENLERNIRNASRLTLFELGAVYLAEPGKNLPAEPLKVALALTGDRLTQSWSGGPAPKIDFYDLKGVIQGMLDQLHISGVAYQAAEDAHLHPGMAAAVYAGESRLGTFGALHPAVAAKYELLGQEVFVAEFDLQALTDAVPERLDIQAPPTFPPAYEDLALVVDESVPADQVEAAIRQGGGKSLGDVRLFDVFTGDQVGAGKKSLTYALAYQAADHTLTPAETAQIRARILKRAGQLVGAKLRE